MSITAVWPWLCKRGGDTLPLYRLSPSSERSDKPISFSGASHNMQTAPHTTCLLHRWSMKSTHTYGLNKPRCKCMHWVVVGGGTHLPTTCSFPQIHFLGPHTHTLTSRALSSLRADQNRRTKAVLVPRTQIHSLSLALPRGSWTVPPCHPQQPKDETIIPHILGLHVTYQTIWIWQVERDQILASY